MDQQKRDNERVNTGSVRRSDRIEPYPIQTRRSQPSARPGSAQAKKPSRKKSRTDRARTNSRPADRTESKREQPASAARVQSENTQRRQISRREMRRRRRRRRLLAVVLAMLLALAGLVLSVTVLFTVKTFRIENLDKTTPADTGIYTEEAILGALSIPLNENMYHFSAKEREKTMASQLPYLETIRVRRSLPSTIVVQIEPAIPSWAVWQPTGWLVLSQGLKIIEQTSEMPAETPVIYGLDAANVLPGTPFEVKVQEVQPILDKDGKVDEAAMEAEKKKQIEYAREKKENIQRLIALMEKNGILNDVTVLDFREEDEAFFVYQDRIKVLLGTFNNLEYKISAVTKLILNEEGKFLNPDDRGILDASHQLDDQVVRIPFDPSPFNIDPPVMEPQTDVDPQADAAEPAAEQTQPDTAEPAADPAAEAQPEAAEPAA